MAKKFTPKVVTANDLLEGDVIYLTAQGSWSRQLEDAVVVTEPDQAEALLEQAEAQVSEQVGAYLADVKIDESGTPQPAHFREAFRTRGPSNYFHGKQEQAKR